MPQPKPVNPFYVALVPAGILFAVTACAYGVMTVQGLDPHRTVENGLIGLMNRHGLLTLVIELAVLAILTVAAIGTDDFWTRRVEGVQTPKSQENESS